MKQILNNLRILGNKEVLAKYQKLHWSTAYCPGPSCRNNFLRLALKKKKKKIGKSRCKSFSVLSNFVWFLIFPKTFYRGLWVKIFLFLTGNWQLNVFSSHTIVFKNVKLVKRPAQKKQAIIITFSLLCKY